MRRPNFHCDIPGVPQNFVNSHPYDTDDILSARRLDENLYEITMQDGEVKIYNDILGSTRRPYQGCYILEEAEQVWTKELGVRLSDILRVRSMTAKDLCRITGLSEASVSGYIHGNKKLSAFALFKICKALDISMDYFTDTVDILAC